MKTIRLNNSNAAKKYHGSYATLNFPESIDNKEVN